MIIGTVITFIPKMMNNKNNILFLLVGIAILHFTINAQTYLPLPDSNATWITGSSCSQGTGYMKFVVNSHSSDTIINSKVYNKIYQVGEILKEYAGAYRSCSDGRTFIIPSFPIDTVEYLLFDISKKPGDTIKYVALFTDYMSITGLYDLVVDSVQYKDSGPYSLKCLFLKVIPPLPPGYNNNPIVWVERIGCLNGGIFNMYRFGLTTEYLKCMSKDDTVLYYAGFSNYWFSENFYLEYDTGFCELPPASIDEDVSESYRATIYPNPFTEHVILTNPPSKPFEVWIYTITGERVYFNEYNLSINNVIIDCNFDPGIYIIKIISDYELITVKKIIKI